MNTRAIHFRLIAWYSALVVLVVAGLGAFTYRSLQYRLQQEMERTLTRRAEGIQSNILATPTEPVAKTVARNIQAVYAPEANSRFIRITRADGSVFYISGMPKDDLFDPGQIALPAEKPTITTTRRETVASGSDLLVVAVPKRIHGEPWLIEMGAPLQEIETALHELLFTLLISLPALVLVAAAGGYYLVQRSLKPVEDIRATAEKITFGNLSNRLPVVASGDALEHLSVTLNHMLDRLEAAYQQASRFSADASHELRTPLTIMRTEMESILQEAVVDDAMRERLGSVLEETEHLSHIAESLFSISRLDAGEAKMSSSVFDLVDMVNATSEQMQLLAEEKQIDLQIHAVRPVPVEGDQTRLKQIVVNLLDNAIKYTPCGGTVSIQVTPFASKTVLEVRDNGIGIAADELPHVFERFYRANKVRTREAGGAGLGLSIVRSIVLAHGGTVDIESTEGMGTKVTITLPLHALKQGKSHEK